MVRGLIASFTLGVLGSATLAAPSVWDEAKRSAYQVRGRVLSIATSESEILVRISDGKETQTYRLCSSIPGGDSLNLAESERMRSLRDAFNRGQNVTASYNGPFDRCISYVELGKDGSQDIKSAKSAKRERPSL